LQPRVFGLAEMWIKSSRLKPLPQERCGRAAASRLRHNRRPRRTKGSPAMRLPVLLAIVVTASACGGVEYRDSNAAVDANPLCASAPSQPGEPMSKDCERVREATWSGEDKDQGEPLDFSGKKDD